MVVDLIAVTNLYGKLAVGILAVWVFSICYSIYMAVLNYRQSKVRDLVIETNRLLKEILGVLKK